MAFVLRSVVLDGRSFEIARHFRKDNNVTLVTGANGTGKTRLLAGLAAQFSGRTIMPSSTASFVRGSTSRDSLDEPSRVVAQTFSPFSRFPAERAQALSLGEYLHQPAQKYVAVGFTKAASLRSSISKDAIGRIVRKLYTQPGQAVPLANALGTLGFEPKLRITYYRSPVGPMLNLDESDPKKLRAAIEEFLEHLALKSKKSGEEIRMAREIESQPRVALTNQLVHAITSVQFSLPGSIGRQGRPEYTIDLPLPGDAKNPHPGLEGTITLARLGLFRVSDCVLWTIPGGRWRRETQTAIFANELSIVEASSGEQQLLSSLFGLVAEMQDDSLILIDEPELSLHPSWQTQFLDLLMSVIRPFYGCHVLVATHSPLLAQRGQELGIPILSLDDNDRATPSLGAPTSVEQTLVDVFDLPVRESTYVGRLLLSLVMAAEDNPEFQANSRRRIQELRTLYERATIRDYTTLQLIQDALTLVDLGPQDRVDEGDET